MKKNQIQLDKLNIAYSKDSMDKEGKEDFIGQLILYSSNREYNLSLIQEKFGGDEVLNREIYDLILTSHVNKYQRFWSLQMDKSGLKVKDIEMDEPNYMKFLNEEFHIYRIKEGGKFEYVTIYDNIVETIDIDHIKFLVQDWVEQLPEKFDLISRHKLHQFILRGAKKFFNDDLFEFLPRIQQGQKIGDVVFKWMKDTDTHSFHFLENTCLVVDKDGVKSFPFSELRGFIWRSQIKPINYVETSIRSKFDTFIRILCKNDESRYADTITTLGYMLHTYKFRDKTYSICLNDQYRKSKEDIEDVAEGGTGKGVIFQGLAVLRNMITIDGKFLNFSKSFLFSRVNLDTQIIFFDDVDEKFPFSKMFSIITEGITTEKKGVDEMYISYQDMGKVGFSTNYLIMGKGNSYKRRKIDVEVASYFTENHSIKDETGEMFFDDDYWGDEEWSAFVNTMIDYQIAYFKRGVQRPVTDTMEISQISQVLPNGLFDKLEFEKIIRLNTKYSIPELTGIINKNTFFKNPVKSIYAKECVRKWCIYKKFNFLEKGGKSRYIIITTNNPDDIEGDNPFGAPIPEEELPF